MKRRTFISNVIIGATGGVLSASLFGLESCSSLKSNRKIVLGLIGCGLRGTDIAIGICKSNAEVMLKYVCDVDTSKAAVTVQTINKQFGYLPKSLSDMKEIYTDKEVDAVIIATPDHWHALATVLACQAGKDVFVEASLGHSLWEGKKIQEAAVRYKRIIQVGFQHRSAGYAQTAREYVQRGKLGQIIHVKSYNLFGGSRWLPEPNSDAPQGLDWDAWLGPAPKNEYNRGIFDVNIQGGWKNYWNYSGGILANETSHLLDLARMVLGDPGHPKSIYCSGGNLCWNSDREVPENQSITYDYGKFAITCETGNAMSYMKIGGVSGPPPDWMRTSLRIEVFGTEGLMYLGLNGRGWQVFGKSGVIITGESGSNPDEVHFKNFIDCVRTRRNPASNVEQGHLSTSLVHLGNIAYRVGKKQLLFDAHKEIFMDNDQANGLLKTAYRGGYVVPEKV